MCGITGIYSLDGNPVQTEVISAQIETIVHRGPNQGGYYLSPRKICGLGIRRLSIVDVQGGDQPLHNEDNSVHLVYNGETYNHTDLRHELKSLGHQLCSHSDAEVVLHGYEAWGAESILRRMRGMAAFALWDENERQLLLGRDRFGIKPLYYATHAGRLYFGSEIKTILAQPNFPRRVNLQALTAMLTLGFVPGPATMFEGIYKLPPAHFLLAQNGSLQIKRYWHLDYVPTATLSQQEAADQFLSLLEEAVALRLMGEVPLGALLSGGLDSGTLVALVQIGLNQFTTPHSAQIGTIGRRIAQSMTDLSLNVWKADHHLAGNSLGLEHKLQTMSIGFEHVAYDESARAQEMAQFIGTNHQRLTFLDRSFDDYPAIMRHLEEPQCSATAVPIYKLYQACHQAGLTVVLTGEGADELLGGYHWHKGDALMRPLLALPESLRHILAASPLPMSDAARRVLRRGAKDVNIRYRDWLEVEGGTYRCRLLSSDVNAALEVDKVNPLLTNWTQNLYQQPATVPPLHQTLWLESRTRMVDFINFEVDKMSMAHSIEARVPFLDHKLWEFCATLPVHYKLKGQTEKHLLRCATKGLLPHPTRMRRKQGLAAPYAAWLRADQLPAWAEEALTSTRLRQAGLFAPQVVQNLRQAHQAGEPNLGPLLMGVLSTQIWYEQFIR